MSNAHLYSVVLLIGMCLFGLRHCYGIHFQVEWGDRVAVLVCFHYLLLWTLIPSSPCSSWLYKRFLRCSPFDEFSLWKSQVDNGSAKGGERLSILTRSLLLRRTKDQLDSTGKPLVTRFLPIPSEAREGGWPGPQVDQPCVRSLSLLRRPSLEQSPMLCWHSPFQGRELLSRGWHERASVLGVCSEDSDGLQSFLLPFQVPLPQRRFRLHRLKLSEDEQDVYDVFLARSRWVLWRSTFSGFPFLAWGEVWT